MKSLLVLALTLLSTATWAFPEAPFDALSESQLKSRSFNINTGYDFEGIVKLNNCSGSLVVFNGMPLSAKAIVMTNGHCISTGPFGGFLKPGEVWHNRSAKRAMKIFDKNMKLHNINATKVLYATMTNTDVAYYELDQSYTDILNAMNIRPLMLDAQHPVIGTDIEIISGYWDRGYSCAIDGFVFKLKEDNWTFTDSIRYTEGCDTIGGTSGSPIIAKGERTVIGINNTSNESGKRCAMNNPCEVSESGEIFVQKGLRYGQQTYDVYTCLTADFRIDLSKRGCELPR